jgi:HEPN domain-containing protein
MQPDRGLVDETRAWLTRAKTDIAAGRFELTAEPPFAAHALHAQQAAEKAMKGYLTWHGRAFRKTHSLVELGGACAGIDATLASLLRRAAPLTQYAWKYRYPGEPGEPSREEAMAALATAESVLDAILARLSDAVRP